MLASRGGSKEMRYPIQFLDGSANVIAEWRIDAQNAGRAIELARGCALAGRRGLDANSLTRAGARSTSG